MSSDPGELVPQGPYADHTLPEVLAVRTSRTSFEPQRRRFRSALPAVSDAVEFLVETAAPIPVRGMGPVLYVGTTPVMEVRSDDRAHYRFTALWPDQLEPGAPLSLGWLGSEPHERASTGFRYEPPSE